LYKKIIRLQTSVQKIESENYWQTKSSWWVEVTKVLWIAYNNQQDWQRLISGIAERVLK
jgi:hypothetical protein